MSKVMNNEKGEWGARRTLPADESGQLAVFNVSLFSEPHIVRHTISSHQNLEQTRRGPPQSRTISEYVCMYGIFIRAYRNVNACVQGERASELRDQLILGERGCAIIA